MKFPDYSKNIHLLILQQQMGIHALPRLPLVEFKKSVAINVTKQVSNTDGMKTRRKLTDRGIDVNASELISDKNSILTYKGQRVAAYIRDQKYTSEIEREINLYYHLCDCLTLRHMRVHAKSQRFVATRRGDGYFRVNEISGENISTGLVKLDICPHCREYLIYTGTYRHPFLLTDYFVLDENEIPETVAEVEAATEEQEYQPDAEELFQAYRKAANYKCQLCGVDCSDPDFQNLLNMHYRDGNPANIHSENLGILCLDCYCHQPGRRFRPQPDPDDIRRINALRKSQEIISAAVFAHLKN